MNHKIQKDKRLASRVILINSLGSVLYLRAKETSTGKTFWVMPGGGLKDGESFEEAARRELKEETGCAFTLGPFVWFRTHKYLWNGRPAVQYERFFVARTDCMEMFPEKKDSYILDHRWWTIDELRTSEETFAPRGVADLLPAIIKGNYPDEPFDCGV